MKRASICILLCVCLIQISVVSASAAASSALVPVGQAVGLAYGPQQEALYRHLLACYEGAAFGRRDVAAEDAEQIRIYLAEVKKKVTAERGWRARLSDRFRDALY